MAKFEQNLIDRVSKLDVDKQVQFWSEMARIALGVSEEGGRKGIVDDEGQSAFVGVK